VARKVALAAAGLALVSACGSESLLPSATLACILRQRGVEAVESSIGEQRFVRFADGSLVGVVLEPSADEAARLGSAAGGPGDPYAYQTVGRYLVAWRGSPNDSHVRLVERCLSGRYSP
jgi:hypothetical protein